MSEKPIDTTQTATLADTNSDAVLFADELSDQGFGVITVGVITASIGPLPTAPMQVVLWTLFAVCAGLIAFSLLTDFLADRLKEDVDEPDQVTCPRCGSEPTHIDVNGPGAVRVQPCGCRAALEVLDT